MATYRPELHTAEAVLQFYMNEENPRFILYAGQKPDASFCRGSYMGDEKSTGEEILRQNLDSLLANTDNTNPYLLQIVAPARKTNKTAFEFKGETLVCPVSQITFQLNRLERMYPYMPGMAQANNSSQEIANLRNELSALRLQLEMKNQEEEEEEPEPESMGIIGKLLNNEQIQGAIVMGLVNLIGGGKPIRALAGTDAMNDQDKLSRALEILLQHDDRLADDLMLLANIAQENPPQFNMLISMLRK